MKIIYVGGIGFPFPSAAVNRRLQIIGILKREFVEVFVLLRFGTVSYSKAKSTNLKIKGRFDNIQYFHSSLLCFRSKIYVIRNFFKFIGFVVELFAILILKFTGYNYLFVDTMDILLLKYYFFLSKLFNLILVYDYVELVDAINSKNARELNEIELKYDNSFFRYVDYLIVISPFLKNFVIENGYHKSIYLLPPTLSLNNNLNIYNTLLFSDYKNSLVYCGSIGYKNDIIFTINAYSISDSMKNNVKLLLILHGRSDLIREIYKLIEDLGLSSYVTILSDFSYDDLLTLFSGAKALLLPLTDNLQNKARFPFKLCEYTFAGKPIISNYTGVMNEYFINGINALLTEPDSITLFADSINYVINNSSKAEIIGVNGRELFVNFFNSANYSFKSFIIK